MAKFVADGDADLEKEFVEVIAARKFMPGGRYLYSAGRELPQLTNCFLLKAEDSREGWGKLLDRHVVALSTGGGCGTEYSAVRPKGSPINRYGGVASGPVSLMQMINEVARHVMAGGKRRSALWAGLAWDHPDVLEFIKLKNWPTDVRAIKERDFNYPAPLDMTNISVRLDDRFFREVRKDQDVWWLYYQIVKSMCKTGEPGFSIDLGKKKNDILRNPCQPASAPVLTRSGISTIGQVREGDEIWTGKAWSRVVRKWATGNKRVREYRTLRGVFVGTENHRVVSEGKKVEVRHARGIDQVAGPVAGSVELNPRAVMDGLVIGDGTVHKASNNLVLLSIGEKDWDYFESEVRSLIRRKRDGIDLTAYEVETSITAQELPYTYKRVVPERYFWADFPMMLSFLRGLFSANGSVVNSHTKMRSRVTLKQSSEVLIRQVQVMLSAIGIPSYLTTTKATKIQHGNGEYESRPSYTLNISDAESIEVFFQKVGFIQKYKRPLYAGVDRPKRCSAIVEVVDLGDQDVYDIMVEATEHVYWTGGLLVSNCTEVVSSDDSDCCNLGSIALGRIENVDELKSVTRTAVRFLYRGTYRGWLPHQDFADVREKNRRIGLGVMGLHDWCLKHGFKYEPNGELGRWLSAWANISDDEAKKCAKKYNGVVPAGVRAIAPTGTIGIVAETTTGIEPIFCVAYKRRFLDEGGKTKFMYVIDPTAERAIKEYGVSADEIEDAYTLASDVERRIAMQAFVQDFVDQAISSTINLPEWGEPGNNNAKQFAETLLRYLPRLRGITVYPEGARPGQPITPVKYETAKKHTETVYEEASERCAGGVCGV